MAQKLANTEDEIIAAGHALLRKGVEPTRAKLYKQLGNRGHTTTIWRVWEAHRTTARSAQFAPDEAEMPDASPELSGAMNAVRLAITALLARQREELTTPHARLVAALQDSLQRAHDEIADRDEVIDALHAQLETLTAELRLARLVPLKDSGGMAGLLASSRAWTKDQGARPGTS